MYASAPRILNEQIAVWFSCFTQRDPPTLALSSGQSYAGVTGTIAPIEGAIASISSSVGSGCAGMESNQSSSPRTTRARKG